MADPANREAARASARKYDSTHREVRRAWDHSRSIASKARHKVAARKLLIGQYGLSPETFGILLGKQEGLCAICTRVLTPGKGTHIDHCHADGAVRGLLCARCNPMLGLAGDDARILQRGVEYLSVSPRMAQ